MNDRNWDLDRDLGTVRELFPILEKSTYLISNSLGAVPVTAEKELRRFYGLWAGCGVEAWEKEWWGLSREVGDRVASLIGAHEDEVTMMTNATLCHWVALSTKFGEKEGDRNRILMTDHDFPSILYAVRGLAPAMGWEVEVVPSGGRPGIEIDEILDRMDERTLFVAASHVYFKSAYVQDVGKIARRARDVGALTLIDGYHAPGALPVDVRELGVDFYAGGCLKWLCGGPGNAFLYVRRELRESLHPRLTGWFAHRNPFSFSPDMDFTPGSYRFMAGTPPVPCLYTAKAGLEVIGRIGVSAIRRKSLALTDAVIAGAVKRGFPVHSPVEKEHRGGAVSLGIPHAFQVKKALAARRIQVDFRKGKGAEPDVIRVGPHFYTKPEEIEVFFEAVDAVLESGEYKRFRGPGGGVT